MHRATAPNPFPVVRVLALLGLLLGLCAGTGVVARPAHAQVAQAEVELTGISPTVPAGGEDPEATVRATGTVTNSGDVDLHDITAAFWVDSTPLETRDDIAEAAAEEPGERLATRIAEPYTLVDQVNPRLDPGESARFELEIPVRYLQLDGPGSYVVGADIQATIPPYGDRDTVGRVRSFLPLVPDGSSAGSGQDNPGQPVEIALVIPIVSDPAFLNGRTVLDEAVTRAFDPDGRLTRLLELGSRYDVTWLVDPALLQQAEMVASGARYPDGSAPTHEAASENARDWLNQALSQFNEDNTLWLPYADPDLTALEHAGLAADLPTSVEAAQEIASANGLTAQLPSEPGEFTPDGADPDAEPKTDPAAPPADGDDPNGGGSPPADADEPQDSAGTDQDGADETSDGETDDAQDATPDDAEPDDGSEPSEPDTGSAVFGLPGTGFADAATLEAFASADPGGVILSQKALPDLPNDGSAPVVSLATPNGAVTALVTDPTLTAGGPPGGNESVLTRQRLLSETSLLAMTGDANGSADTDGPADTGSPRRIVATLPRDWPADGAAEQLLETVESADWLEMVTAPTILTDPPLAHGGRLNYPGDARTNELGEESLAEIGSFAADTADYLTMLAEPEAERERLARDLLRGASTAWRDSANRGVALLRAARERLQATRDRVTVVSPRFVTLSSRSGSFPVTIANENDFAVEVSVDVRTRVPGMLDVAPLDTVVIPPNRRETQAVTAEMTQGGVVQVDVGLATPAGTTFGERKDFAVRSTEYGLVGWAVLGVGIGLLTFATIIRIVRRLRGRGAASSDGSSPTESTA